MKAEDYIKAELARISYLDGRDEGLNGCVAVALVIRYRIRAGWFNGDWMSLLSHHQDYAAVLTEYTHELPDPRNTTFGMLLQQIDGIFSGSREDDILTPGPSMGQIVAFDGQPARPVALYYGRLNDPNIRPWFLESISQNHDNHRQVASVGGLTFFS